MYKDKHCLSLENKQVLSRKRILEMAPTDSRKSSFTGLNSEKETKVTWAYSKKAVESAHKGIEADEEPTGTLTVSKSL